MNKSLIFHPFLRLPRRFPWAGRAALGLILALLVVAFTGPGCMQGSKPAEAAQAFKNAQDLEKRGDLTTAMQKYLESVRFDSQSPTAPDALVHAADLALRTGHPDQAVTAYTTLQHPPHPAQVKLGDQIVRVPEDVENRLHDAMVAADAANSRQWTYFPLDFLVRLTGKNPAYSYWFAIVIFTVIIKAALTPLTVMQQKNTRRMTLIQPQLKEIQDKFRDRPDELNRRMMALYKEEGVNPLGCGSGMILQMGAMIVVYRFVLAYKYQFMNGQFLWVGSGLHHMFPQVIGANLGMPDIPLLVIYAISMYLQSKITMVPSVDPQQAQQQKMMSVMMPMMLLVFLQNFPSAFALYWLLFNMLSTFQQMQINKQLDLERGIIRGGDGDEPPGLQPVPIKKTPPLGGPKPRSTGAGKRPGRRK